MKRLLLVDDDEATRMMCRRLLAAEAGATMHIEEARSGEDAIDALRASAFDCIVTDYRMGFVSGIDVLAYALERRAEARRVLMSGFADPAIVEAAQMRARIHAFIEKPILLHELEAELRRHVLAPLGVTPREA